MSRRAPPLLCPASLRVAGLRPVLALVLAGAAVPALGQIGGPIGAPVGVPNGLPAGITGYSANVGGALPPPVNNWSAGEAGRGEFGARFGGGSGRGPGAGNGRPNAVEVPLPRHQIRNDQSARGASGPQDPREPAGSGRASAAAGDDWRGGDEPARRFEDRQATRPVAAVAEPSRVDVLRDLVQRGQLYETGLGHPKDLNRAFGLYCEAGASGYPDALVKMGLMYAEGNGVEKNQDAAGTLFRRAARFGSALGADLSKRYPVGQELLPQCLKGTVVERGTAERPATAEELAAVVQKLDSGVVIRNPVVGAERARLVNAVIAEARQYKLDPRLVLAVMATESGFDPNAKSQKNAVGLMQLIPETAERFAVANVLDPVENIRGGMAYLRWLLSYFRGDVTLTLAAYNAGEGAVDKYNGVPPFTETLAYVQRIRAIYPHDRHPYDPAAATAVSRTAPGTRTADAKATAGAAAIARN